MTTLFLIPDVLSVDECAAAIEETESLGYQAAPISTRRGPRMAPEVRNNTRVMVDDSDRADDIWSRVRAKVPAWLGPWQAIGLNERWRYYRYAPGQRFRWHYDGSYRRSGYERSLLSFILYLNDDFLGGETRFEYQGTTIQPRRGAVLVFEHRILHEGSAPRVGTKYVMRSDVMYRIER